MTKLASVAIYEQNSISFARDLIPFAWIIISFYRDLIPFAQFINSFSRDLIPFARIINQFSQYINPLAQIINPFSRDLIPFAQIIFSVLPVLPVETGRWRRIRREDRKCHLCQLEIGDEYHYMLTCSYLSNLRRQYKDRKFFTRPKTIKFSMLLNTTHPAKLRKLCNFIKSIFFSF